MSTCVGCGSTGPMSKQPMAACADGKGMCLECERMLEDVKGLSRGVMKLMGFVDEKVSDDDPLFQDPPPKEDCPICMLPIPVNSGTCDVHTMYQTCCGKTLCQGCVEAAKEEINKGKMKDLCPFCRKVRICIVLSCKCMCVQYFRRDYLCTY